MQNVVPANTGRVSLFAAAVVCIAAFASAQTVPAPWKAADLGAPTLSGTASQASGIFTITGAGTDIGGTSDQFIFVYQQVSGDVDIVARVDDLDGAGDYAKAGVMIRRSLSANAAHAFSHATVGAGVRALRRLTDGGKTMASAGAGAAAPIWVRATRKGTQVTTYWSSNGTTWTAVSTDTITFGSSLYVGLAVNGRSSSSRATAVLSNVKVTAAAASGTLPAGQQGADLGSPALAGSVSYAAGSYTVKAAGADIWDVADQFHFVYQPVTGDVDVVARVASITRAHDWSKAGVMIRESLTAASRHASMFTSSAKGYAFQRRPQTGEYSTHTSGGTGTAPGWVRLVRTGDLFEAYRSANGSTWTKVGSDTIPMGSTVYVGLAVTSHSASTATTAVVDSVKIAAAASGNRAPAVSVTAPTNGTAVTAPATVTVTASATDPENRLLSVDFYAGSTLIARDSTAPYSASWSAGTAGSYALTAVAHDADGASTTSAAVTVTVSGSSTTAAPTAVAFTASTDHATNVTSYLLRVYTAGANPATATPVASSDLGKPAPDSVRTITVDRRTFFSGLAAGSYIATVTAIGPGGQTPSGGVAFTR
jgi:regulation of enolase protein 1 (concanavalin A-like superfamily)